MELQLHGSNRVVYKAQLHGRVFQTLGQHIRSLLQCLPFLSILLLYLPSFPVWLSCSGCRSNDKVFIIVSKWIPREDLVAWTSPALTMTVIDRDWGGSSLPYFCFWETNLEGLKCPERWLETCTFIRFSISSIVLSLTFFYGKALRRLELIFIYQLNFFLYKSDRISFLWKWYSYSAKECQGRCYIILCFTSY